MAITTIQKLLPLPLVEERVGFGRNKIYTLMKKGEFPRSRAIQGKVLWHINDIDDWIDTQWQNAESKTAAK